MNGNAPNYGVIKGFGDQECNASRMETSGVHGYGNGAHHCYSLPKGSSSIS